METVKPGAMLRSPDISTLTRYYPTGKFGKSIKPKEVSLSTPVRALYTVPFFNNLIEMKNFTYSRSVGHPSAYILLVG
jgi:hypothetical protein